MYLCKDGKGDTSSFHDVNPGAQHIMALLEADVIKHHLIEGKIMDDKKQTDKCKQ